MHDNSAVDLTVRRDSYGLEFQFGHSKKMQIWLMISTGYFIRRLLNKLVKITELTFCKISFLFRYLSMHLKCFSFLRIVNYYKFYIWHFLIALIFWSTLFFNLLSNFCQLLWWFGSEVKEYYSLFQWLKVLKTGSYKIIDWLVRYSFRLGFVISKNPKRILYSNQQFSTQPLIFWHNKVQKERVSTESINYLIRSHL